jgi:GT2 family glycosyltransferase
VHADTWVEPEAGAALLRCLRDPLVVGGGCWKRFRDGTWVMRGSRFRCWLRLWWNGRVLGDQAMFVRREVLKEVGGVPRQPLLEELELCRRLRRVGRLALAGTAVSTSARRFREHGVWRTWWLMGRIWRDYRRGVSPEELVERYHGKR